MTIYLIAGTNGSGKSTFLANCIESGFIPPVEYVCQGFHNANFFSQMKSSGFCEYKLRDFHKYKMNRLLFQEDPMIIEHALADNDIFAFLKRAKKLHYKVISFYLTTSSPKINIKNITKRVEQGGHGCGAIKVYLRFFLTKYYFNKLKRVSDELYVFSNSDRLKLKYIRIGTQKLHS